MQQVMIQKPQRIGQTRLCDGEHAALKADDAIWECALFIAYQPLGEQLGEYRLCPTCLSRVLRPISFIKALAEVLKNLADCWGPADLTTHSAAILDGWARENIPAWLGLTAAPPPPPTVPPSVGLHADLWLVLGRELRVRRTRAHFTRKVLSRIAGVAEATIRNIERGRHRPTTRTLARLQLVPQLCLNGSLLPAGYDGRSFSYLWQLDLHRESTGRAASPISQLAIQIRAPRP